MRVWRRLDLLIPALLVGLVLTLAPLFIGLHYDPSFITYRYAHNLAAGAGLVYNPGQRVLSDAVAPLYAAILALGSAITPDLPLLSNILGVVSMALGTLGMFGLARAGAPPDDPASAAASATSDAGSSTPTLLTAAAAAAVYAVFPLLWLSLGMDAALWAACGLLAVWMHLRGWPGGAPLLLALATLMRPEMAVLAVVLLADAILTGRSLNLLALSIYAGVVLAGVVWLLGAFDSGGPLPGLPGVGSSEAPPGVFAGSVLAGLAKFGEAFVALSPLWVGALALALTGLIPLRKTRWAAILVAWAGLHVVTLGLFGAAVYVWHFAPLAAALSALIAAGARWIVERSAAPGVRRALAGICALIVAGAAAETHLRHGLTPLPERGAWRALQPGLIAEGDALAGWWLLYNTPPDAVVGATHSGVLGYISKRPILDYGGALQPDLAAARQRHDSLWWLYQHTPDYIVLRASEQAALLGDPPDPWLAATYTEAGRFGTDGDPSILLARAAEPPALAERLIGMVTYPGGLVLNGIATDFALEPLEGGRSGRLRLEWLLDEPARSPLYVAIRVAGRDGSLAALGGRMVDFRGWPVRRLHTTFHTVDLAPVLAPGVYDVAVGIGPDSSQVAWQTVARAKIPFPEAAFVGAVSGAQAAFGDITLLGYRLNSTDQGVEVVLLWQAVRPPVADYRVFIQVRDAQGSIAAQVTVEPHEGAYPTSIWSAGEQVADTYRLDTGGLPPGDYHVFAGLLDPDGSRLLTLDGQDAVFIGSLSIQAP